MREGRAGDRITDRQRDFNAMLASHRSKFQRSKSKLPDLCPLCEDIHTRRLPGGRQTPICTMCWVTLGKPSWKESESLAEEARATQKQLEDEERPW